jgi:glutamate-1-semialdehyde 2,1-aminomutase
MDRAKDIIPGGTNSGARFVLARGIYEGFEVPVPSFIRRGEGAYLYDVDGNKYIDYNCAFGPIILGHANPAVNAAVKEQLDSGTLYGANTEIEIKLTEKFVKHVPCAEQVLLCMTGAEATSIAHRIARSYTGNEKILRFEGTYHGWHDWAMVYTASSVTGTYAKSLGQKVLGADGVPQRVIDDVFVIPWNDPEALEKLIRKHGHELASVITEAYQSNMGVIPPEKGYLELLRKLTKEYGIALIFDEVITGFRLGLGGAQEYTGVTPDFATFAKAMANGFPVAAVASSKKFMEPITTERTWVGGTYNGNAVSTSAALATMTELEKFGSYDQLYARGKELMQGISDALKDNHIPGVVQGAGPMFSVFFTDLERIRFSREVQAIRPDPHLKRSAVYFREIIKRGVLFFPLRFGRVYMSFAHSKQDVQVAIEAVQQTMKEVKKIK